MLMGLVCKPQGQLSGREPAASTLDIFTTSSHLVHSPSSCPQDEDAFAAPAISERADSGLNPARTGSEPHRSVTATPCLCCMIHVQASIGQCRPTEPSQTSRPAPPLEALSGHRHSVAACILPHPRSTNSGRFTFLTPPPRRAHARNNRRSSLQLGPAAGGLFGDQDEMFGAEGDMEGGMLFDGMMDPLGGMMGQDDPLGFGGGSPL